MAQAGKFLFQTLQHVIRQLAPLHPLAIFLNLTAAILAVAQLPVDSAQLLPQIIFPLVFVNLIMHSGADFTLQIQNLRFLGNHTQQHCHALHQVKRLQQALPFLQRQKQITGHGVGQFAGLLQPIDVVGSLRRIFFI